MTLLVAQYIDPEDVQSYLLNKIDTGTDLELQQITPEVLSSWVRQGEIKVEIALQPFYLVPFQTTTGDAWTSLPTTTYDLLWSIMMTSAQIWILEQQFGRITNTTGQDYLANLWTEYKTYLNTFYMKTSNGSYILGQAASLAVNPVASNSNGLIPEARSHINMYSPQMRYAIRQINNPEHTWYNARIYANRFR